jgi:hypothetical protein
MDDEQPTGGRVTARRTGPGQVFVLSAPGDERRWCVKQWASKPRPSRQEYHPWWYTEGWTWHLYEGGKPVLTEDGELTPPAASFATIEQAKVYVESLLPPDPSAG